MVLRERETHPGEVNTVKGFERCKQGEGEGGWKDRFVPSHPPPPSL